MRDMFYCTLVIQETQSGGSFEPQTMFTDVLFGTCDYTHTHTHNTDDPLVGSIARQYLNERHKHDQTARLWTQRYAK